MQSSKAKQRSRFFITAGLVFFLAIAMGLPFQVTVQAKEVYRMRVQTFQRPTDNIVNLAMVDFMKALEKKSNGRLKLLPLLDVGAVCGTRDIFDAVSTGVLDAALTAPVYYMGKVPSGAVIFGMPYSWMTFDDVHDVVYNHGLLDVVRKDFARHNIYYASMITSTELVWFTKKRPLKTKEDFKGMKLRVLGAGQYAPKKFGASIVQVAYPELYTALQQGVIDGCNTILDALTTLNFNEVVDYVIMPPSVLDTICVIVNMDKWKKLPPDLQKLWQEETLRFSKANYQRVQKEGEENIAKAKSMGVKVVEMDPELVGEMRKVSVEEGWEWIAQKSPLGREAVDIVIDYYRKKGKLE